MIRLEIIESRDGFNAMRGQWDALLEQPVRASIFLTWQWLDLWLQHYGRDCRLCIVTGTNDHGELVAIAPLMVRPVRMFGFMTRSLEFIGSGEEITPDHLRFIALPGVRDEFAGRVFDCLRQRRSTWDMVRLRDTDEDDDLTALVNGAGRARHDRAGSPLDRCPYIPLPGSWDTYLAGLSRHIRYRIKTFERDLREKYGAVFSVVKDTAALGPAMAALEDLHRRRMDDKRLSGASLDERFWRFHAAAARLLLSRGCLLLGMLSIGEKIIACNYSFIYRGVVSYYQSGLDPAYKAHSAGFVLTTRMVREAIDRGMTEFDLMRGDEPYKFRLTKYVRESRTLYIWNDTALGGALCALYRMKAWTRRRIRPVKKEQVPDDTH